MTSELLEMSEYQAHNFWKFHCILNNEKRRCVYCNSSNLIFVKVYSSNNMEFYKLKCRGCGKTIIKVFKNTINKIILNFLNAPDITAQLHLKHKVNPHE